MFPAELEDRYELIRPLGEGGYGSVYLVKDRRLGRELALKVLDGIAADPAQAERFRREARVTSQLQHPNVVQVFDHGDLPEGRGFIGYEFVDGHDLAAVLERREAVPLAQLLKWGSSIASALQAAHDKGITHRDLKPANILLRADGQALLCDFGVARLADSRTVQTREGLILGTPSYVAPEIWYGAAPGPLADQFSLAATLYEVLYRRRPFPSDEPIPIWNALKGGWKPAVPLERAGEHPLLERTLLRALAPRPEDRYASVGDFGRALTQTEGTHGFQAAGGASTSGATQVVAAPPDTLTQPGGLTRKTLRPQITRTEAWAPRRKAGVTALVLVLVALGGWLAWPRGEGPASLPVHEPGSTVATAPGMEELANLQAARVRLPAILQDTPAGLIHHEVPPVLRELIEPRLELKLNRYLDAQIAWLRAVDQAGEGWSAPPVRAALVTDVLAPIHAIAAVFATLQHRGSRMFGDTLNLEESGLTREEFLGPMLRQKKRLMERIGDHYIALDELLSEQPDALHIARGFLTLYFLSEWRHPRTEGLDHGRFAEAVVTRLEAQTPGTPVARYAMNQAGWVILIVPFMHLPCEQTLDLSRRIHLRALLADGVQGTPLATNLQALVRAGVTAGRSARKCPDSPADGLLNQVDEAIEVLATYAQEHGSLIDELAQEFREGFRHHASRGSPDLTAALEARIERLRTLREDSSG